MRRLTAVLLLAGCVGFHAQAQTPPQPSAAQTPATSAPAAQTAPGQESKPEAGSRKPEGESREPGAPESSAASPAGQAASPQPELSGFPLDQIPEFSAIAVGGILTSDANPRHIYRSGNFLRIESIDQHSWWIVDLIKKREFLLAPKICMKSELPNSRAFPFFLTGPEYTYERVPGGEETVNGHQCRIEDVTVKSPNLKYPVHLRLWEAEDLQGFPIKIENRPEHFPHRSWEYKKVDVGPQDPTLFLHPESCQDLPDKGAVKVSPKSKKEPAGKSQ